MFFRSCLCFCCSCHYWRDFLWRPEAFSFGNSGNAPIRPPSLQMSPHPTILSRRKTFNPIKSPNVSPLVFVYPFSPSRPPFFFCTARDVLSIVNASICCLSVECHECSRRGLPDSIQCLTVYGPYSGGCQRCSWDSSKTVSLHKLLSGRLPF